MSCVTSLPDVNIHNRTLVIPEGDDELLIADASDHYRLKKILVSSLESSGGSDHHASWDVILVGETVTILYFLGDNFIVVLMVACTALFIYTTKTDGNGWRKQ